MMKKVISHQSSVIGWAQEQGFTLIEVLLASFIFMSVVTIAIGSFTGQLALQSSTEAQRNVQQTVQSIVEAISRDVRTIEDFEFRGGGCLTPTPYEDCSTRLSFNPADAPGSSKRREYRYNRVAQVLDLCDPNDPAPGRCGSPLNDVSRVQITDFRVEGYRVPLGSDRLNQIIQPFVVLTISAQTVPTGRQAEVATLTVRTLITSRLFDKYR